MPPMLFVHLARVGDKHGRDVNFVSTEAVKFHEGVDIHPTAWHRHAIDEGRVLASDMLFINFFPRVKFRHARPL